MISARMFKTKRLKFKTSTPVAAPLTAEERAQAKAIANTSTVEQLEAADLFEAYHNLDTGELVQYIKAHPPSARVVAMVIRIAEASDDPEKPGRLGKQKSDKLWGEVKTKTLQAWAENRNSGKPKTKDKFAEAYSILLAQSGQNVAVGTIYKWLPTKKKK